MKTQDIEKMFKECMNIESEYIVNSAGQICILTKETTGYYFLTDVLQTWDCCISKEFALKLISQTI